MYGFHQKPYPKDERLNRAPAAFYLTGMGLHQPCLQSLAGFLFILSPDAFI